MIRDSKVVQSVCYDRDSEEELLGAVHPQDAHMNHEGKNPHHVGKEDTPAYRALNAANVLCTEHRRKDLFVPAGHVGFLMDDKNQYLFAQPGMVTPAGAQIELMTWRNLKMIYVRAVAPQPAPAGLSAAAVSEPPWPEPQPRVEAMEIFAGSGSMSRARRRRLPAATANGRVVLATTSASAAGAEEVGFEKITIYADDLLAHENVCYWVKRTMMVQDCYNVPETLLSTMLPRQIVVRFQRERVERSIGEQASEGYVAFNLQRQDRTSQAVLTCSWLVVMTLLGEIRTIVPFGTWAAADDDFVGPMDDAPPRRRLHPAHGRRGRLRRRARGRLRRRARRRAARGARRARRRARPGDDGFVPPPFSGDDDATGAGYGSGGFKSWNDREFLIAAGVDTSWDGYLYKFDWRTGNFTLLLDEMVDVHDAQRAADGDRAWVLLSGEYEFGEVSLDGDATELETKVERVASANLDFNHLQLVDDDAHAHNAEYIGDDEYAMFNNNWPVGVGPTNNSELLVVHLDPADTYATVVWSYDTNTKTEYGDNDLLPTGNMLGCWWQTLAVEIEFFGGEECTAGTCLVNASWYTYSAERFFPAARRRDAARRLLAFTTQDTFKRSDAQAGTFQVYDAAYDLVVDAVAFSYVAHWRPTYLNASIGATAGFAGHLVVANAFGTNRTVAVSCAS
ncbi:voltage-gated potassium channel [Aureococcus anophagefferens]|nr:voltage-gated potassium channel [Aureococcus anophagefferens]